MLDKCKSCGAEIEYSATVQSLKCPYCDAINEIKKPEDELPNSVDLIIPLAANQDELEKQVYGYMASGNYTPDDMLEAATFIKRECFYVPAYLFSVDYEATWTASFGYDRKEPYTAYRSVTSNGHTHQEPYTAYRTVTDWRPANGVDSGIFSVSTYAGKLLHESDLSPNSIVPNVLADAKPTKFNASFMSGVQAESFAISETKAFDSLDVVINANVDKKVKTHGQGDHQQDWHWTARMSHSVKTIYVPLCHAVFDYEGTEYHYWVDGISGTSFKADKLPEDHEKKKLVNHGFVPLGLASAGLIASSYFWSFTWASLAVVAALAAYGALRRHSLVSYSKNIRNALLDQIHASSYSGKDLSIADQQKFSQAFQRPVKPFFAQTHNDKLVITSLSTVAFIAALLPAYLISPSNNNSFSYKKNDTSIQEVVKPAIPTISQPSQVPPAVEQPPVLVEQQKTDEGDAVRSASPTPVAKEEESSAAKSPAIQTTPNTVSLPGLGGRVTELLNMAANPQWASIDTLASEIQQQAPIVQKGDRKNGRALNQEGVTLLQQENPVGAIDAFQRGLVADPSDVEIKNNLAYAYILNGDLGSAEKHLSEVLQRLPERSSAWANLSELYARAGNTQTKASQSALRLAVHFSQNRQRTVDYLTRTNQTHNIPLYREIASKVIKEIDYIPSKTSEAAPQSNRVAHTVPLTTPQTNAENKAVASMLANAQSAIFSKRYQEAITTTKNVLAIEPSNVMARRLMENAEEQQRRDLRSVEIR